MSWGRSLLIRGHSAPVYACTILDGLIYSTAGDRFVTCWNSHTGEQQAFTLKSESPAYCVAAIPENNLLLIGCANGTILIVDPTAKKLVCEHNYFGHGIFSLTHFPEQQWIIAGDAEGNLLICDYTGKLLASFPLNCGKIRQLLIVKEELFAACQDGSWRSFELPVLNEIRTQFAHEKGVSALHIDPFAHQLISGGKDGHIRLWDLITGEQLHAFPAHYQTIYGITSVDEHYVSVSMDKTIKIWDRDWQILQRIEQRQGGHSRSVNGCVSLGDNRFVTFGDDRTIAVWSQDAVNR